jgi:hypothetical protein
MKPSPAAFAVFCLSLAALLGTLAPGASEGCWVGLSAADPTLPAQIPLTRPRIISLEIKTRLEQQRCPPPWIEDIFSALRPRAPWAAPYGSDTRRQP